MKGIEWKTGRKNEHLSHLGRNKMSEVGDWKTKVARMLLQGEREQEEEKGYFSSSALWGGNPSFD